MKSFNIGDLNIPVPIIQGGMGVGISLSGLASAVANSGGVGVISSVGIGLIHNNGLKNYRKNNIIAIRDEIIKARKKTNGILGVNIMSVITNYSDMVRTSIEAGIDIIFSGAGLPLELPKYLKKDNKTKLVPIVSSSRAASIICTKWKQNFDYLEYLVTDIKNLTDEIKDTHNVSIPIIAAGGIFSGKDMYDFIKLGANAVQLGTRFVATKECDASQSFKEAFVNAKEDDIKIIKSPVGMPGRTIFNNFLKESNEGKRKPVNCKYKCIKSCNPNTTLYCIAEALVAAYKGNFANGFAFSGSNAGKIFEISSVKKIFRQLIEEYFQAQKETELVLASK